jgi:hypothetical protein
MVEYEELKQRAEQVRDEREPMENTAFRVGGVMVDTIELTEQVRKTVDKQISGVKGELQGNLRVTPSEDGTSEEVTIYVTAGGEQVQPDRVRITKKYGSAEQVLFDGVTTHVMIDSSIRAGEETFILSVQKEGFAPHTEQVTKYLSFIGAGDSDPAASSMQRIVSDSARMRGKVATKAGERIQMLIPSGLEMHKVTSDGISVALDEPRIVQNTYGEYRLYQSRNKLTEADWQIEVY